MAATGVQVNWDDVTFASTPIDRVTNVSISSGAEFIRWKADVAVFDQIIVLVNSQMSINITTGNIGVAMGLAPGTSGTLEATHKDAKKQTGGDINYTMPGIVGNVDNSGAHAQFGTAQVSVFGVSTDGVTNPLSFSRS